MKINRSEKKYFYYIYVIITLVFLFFSYFVLKKNYKNEIDRHSTTIDHIADSINNTLNISNNLSFDLINNSYVEILNKSHSLNGEVIQSIRAMSLEFQKSINMNNAIDSIYLYLPHLGIVLTQSTFYPINDFYDKEIFNETISQNSLISYTLRTIMPSDLTYINECNVITNSRTYPYNSSKPRAILSINYDIKHMLEGYTNYESVTIVSPDTKVDVNAPPLFSSDSKVLYNYSSFSKLSGYKSTKKFYIFYSKLSIADLFCTTTINRLSILQSQFSVIGTTLFFYIIIMVLLRGLTHIYDRISASRSTFLLSKIEGINMSEIKEHDVAFHALGVAVDNMISSNKLLESNSIKYTNIIREMLISDIVTGAYESKEELKRQMQHVNLSFPMKYFTGFVCCISEENIDKSDNYEINKYNTPPLLKDIIVEQLNAKYCVYATLGNNNKIYFFINHDNSLEELKSTIANNLSNIQSIVQKNYDIMIYFSMGSRVSNIREIAKSCYLANKLADAINLQDQEVIIQNSMSVRVTPQYPVAFLNQFIAAYKNKSLDQLGKHCDNFFLTYIKKNNFSISLTKSITDLLLTNIINYLWFDNYIVHIDDLPQYIYNINDKNTFQEIRETFIHTLEELYFMQPSNDSQTTNDTDTYVPKVLEYIKENYFKDLSIADIAKNISLNPRYLGDLFKNATGTTLVKFLNETRVNEAKILLANSTITIKEIGARIGYNDSHAFIRNFKAVTNMTPSEYRDNVKNNVSYGYTE